MKCYRFLYKQQESIIKRYLQLTKGADYKYAFSFWPFIKSVPLSSGQEEIYFCNKKLLQTISFSQLNLAKQEIYILGSGPSVKNQPLENLKGKQIITLNGSITAANQYGFIPFLHIIMDANFVIKRMDLVESIAQDVPLVLTLSALKAVAVFCPNVLKKHPILLAKNPLEPFPLPKRSLEQLSKNDFFISSQVAFSKNSQTGLFDGGTVMSLAIQIAFSLQVKKVFLLGLDISNANEPRFYEHEKNKQKCGLLKDYETKILPFMKLTRQVFDTHGREIYNCSPITKLPYAVIPYFKFSLEEDKQ